MRIAVIGGGITGLGAAWALRMDHDVVMFEADDRLGGHANTRDVAEGPRIVPIDTGFIVHNRRTYPELIALFDALDVPTRATEMSLSIECRECGLQYAGRRPWSLVVGLLRRPSLLPILLGIRTFMRDARDDLARGIDPALTLEQWCAGRDMPPRLVGHFLLPLTASVWSAPPGEALAMPAAYILGFLDNHGMLSASRLEWRTVVGGSRVYVDRMRAELERVGTEVRVSTPVRGIVRHDGGVHVATDEGSERFDAVVLACHADHALGLLGVAATPLERELLAPWTYTHNVATLHDDPGMLPTQRSARAGWNYRLHTCDGAGALPTVSYYMNRLQGLQADGDWSVSLNARDAIDPTRVHYETDYRHPRFSTEAVAAQQRMAELDAAAAETRTAFAGAYRGFGFHEDGLRAGLAAGRLVAELDRELTTT